MLASLKLIESKKDDKLKKDLSLLCNEAFDSLVVGVHIDNIVEHFNKRIPNVPLSLILLDAIRAWGNTVLWRQDSSGRMDMRHAPAGRAVARAADTHISNIRNNHGNMFLRLINSCIDPQDMMYNIRRWTTMTPTDSIETATALPSHFADFLKDVELLALMKELKIDQEGVFVPPDCMVCLEKAVSGEGKTDVVSEWMTGL